MASSLSDAEAAAPALAAGRAKPLSIVALSLVPKLVLRAPRTGLVLTALAILALLGPVLAEESLLKFGWGLVLARHGIDATEGTLGLSMVLGVIASRGLVRARVLMRLAHALRCVSEAQHLHFARESDEIGKMLGGWIRSAHPR